jgi:hypothetical protein
MVSLASVGCAGSADAKGSCGHTMITDPGARVLADPKIHLQFWAGQDAQYAQGIVDALGRAASAGAASRLAEYGVMGLRIDPVAIVVEAQPRSDDAAPVAGTSTGDSITVVVLPPGATTARLQRERADGYHGWDGRHAYAVVAHRDLNDELTGVITHELWEAMTDPDGKTGVHDSVTGGEVADACDTLPWDVVGGTSVAKAWSQAGCGCL